MQSALPEQEADPSPTGVQRGFFYGWTCPGSNPVFCLLICSCGA